MSHLFQQLSCLHTHFQFDPSPWPSSIAFSSNFVPPSLAFSLRPFQIFTFLLCFLLWAPADPEGPSADSPLHFTVISRSFEHLLKSRKSPLFSDLFRFLFYFFLAKHRQGRWRGCACSLPRRCRLLYRSYHYFSCLFGRCRVSWVPEAAGTVVWDPGGRGWMRDAHVPGGTLPRGAARRRQRRTRLSPCPARSPAPRPQLPRDRRWYRPGSGTAPRTHRWRAVTLTQGGGVFPSLPLCPSYRLSVRSGDSAPLYLCRLVSSTLDRKSVV